MRVFELSSTDRFVIRFAHETASLSTLSCVLLKHLKSLFTFVLADS